MYKRIELADGEQAVVSGVYSSTGGNLVIEGWPGANIEAHFTISPDDAIEDGTATWVPFISGGTGTITERIDAQIMAVRVFVWGGEARIEVRV